MSFLLVMAGSWLDTQQAGQPGMGEPVSLRRRRAGEQFREVGFTLVTWHPQSKIQQIDRDQIYRFLPGLAVKFP